MTRTKIVIAALAFFMFAGAINSMSSTSTANASSVEASIAEDRAFRAELDGTACKKDGNAKIGELQARTLKCGWGKPSKINRTVYGSTTREQWVYSSGNYLYFADGRLVTIQN